MSPARTYHYDSDLEAWLTLGAPSVPIIPTGPWNPPPPEPEPGDFVTRYDVGWEGIGSPALTPYQGNVSASGVTILNRSTSGDLIITGSNVTVKGCNIGGQIKVRGGNNVVIEDTTTQGLIFDGATNFRVTRSVAYGVLGHDGMQIKADGGWGVPADGLIEDSWFGAPVVNASSHYDSVQVRGCRRITFRHCTFDHGETPSDRYNATIFLENANGGNYDVLIENNYFRARGYHSLRLYGSGIIVRYNVFAPKITVGGQTWGNPLLSNSYGYVAIGNKYEDDTVAIPDTE